MQEHHDLNKLTKAELITHVEQLNVHYAERVTALEENIRDLEDRLSRRRTDGRKDEVLGLLQTKPMSIFEMSEALNISNKNVSSQLCYLKKDGHRIATNADGLKFLEGYDYSEIDVPNILAVEDEATDNTDTDNQETAA